MKNQFTTLIMLSTLLLHSCMKEKASSDMTMDHSKHRSKSASNYADSVNAELIPQDTLKRSPIRIAMTYVGNNHVHIEYGSPGVKGRIVWGGLVAYDEVWVTGAHNATSIEFNKDLIIDGHEIPSGKYAFFTIPGRDDWTIILNKNWKQHLADNYDQTDDVIRTKVTPQSMKKVIQRLTYSVSKLSEHEGEVIMEWDKIRIVLPFKNKIQ